MNVLKLQTEALEKQVKTQEENMEEIRFDNEIFVQSKIEKEFKLREARRDL